MAQNQQEIDSFEEKVKLELLKIEQERDEWRQELFTARKMLLVKLRQPHALKDPFNRRKKGALIVRKWRQRGERKANFKRQVKFNV